MPGSGGYQIASDFSGRLTRQAIGELIKKWAPVAPAFSTVFNEAPNPIITVEEPEWYDDDLRTIITAIDNVADDYDENTTAPVVDSVASIRPNTLIRFLATGELAMVTAVDTGTKAITIVRGWGSTSAAAASVADDAQIEVVAFAAGEGGSAPDAIHGEPSKFTNLIQHFKETVSRSGRSQRVGTVAPENETERLRMNAFEELMRQMNRQFLYGVKDKQTVNTAPTTTFDGIFPASVVNATAVDGTLTWDALKTIIRPVASRARVPVLRAFCGTTAMDTICALAEATSKVEDSESVLGLAISTVRTPWGVNLALVNDWSLDAGDIHIHVPGRIQIGTTRNEKNSQPFTPQFRELDPGTADMSIGVYEAELTTLYGSPSLMATATGITGAA